MAQHFDVAVVGMQVSGIVTAALLAKRGRRVLLVDHGEDTMMYRRGGFALPLVPRLVPNLETSPQIQQVHRELGLRPELRTAAAVSEPAFQAVMPRHRIDIRNGRDPLLKELKLEFPEIAGPVERFFDGLFALDGEITAFLAEGPQLPPGTWRERLRMRRALRSVAHLDAPFESHELLAGIPHDHPVRDVLLGPLTFFGHLWDAQPSTFHAVRLIARYFRGVLSFDDRLGSLPHFLLSWADRLGVDLRMGAVVQEIGLRGRRIESVHLEADRQPYTADFFVTNTIGPFHELLPPGARHPRYVLEDQRVAPAGSLLVLNLVVSSTVIPCGMSDAVFLLNGRRQGRGDDPVDPPLFLRRYPAHIAQPRTAAKNPRTVRMPPASEEHEVICVACPARVQEISRSPERFAALKSQMLGRVGRVVPFLSDFLVDTSLPVETGSWDLEDSSANRRVDPWRLHPIYQAPSRPLLGVAARPVRTYFKNAVHCGPDVLPGLGLEGEYMAGLAAANQLQNSAGKAWRSRAC